MSAALQLDDISCTFISRDQPGQRYTAVRDVTLTVDAGEFVSVVGPTGCGKSTLLNVAAGLLAPSTGSVRVFGQALDGINRRAGYMFQADSLMPWRTALGNVTAGLEFRGLPRRARLARRGSSVSGSADSAIAIRTSSRAACASARVSRRRSPSTPTSS
jgi:NitT/TauT family transport system ATP-binding protein